MNEHRATKDLNWVRIPLGSFFFVVTTRICSGAQDLFLFISYTHYPCTISGTHTQANPRNVSHSLVIVVCNVYNNYMYLMYSNICVCTCNVYHNIYIYMVYSNTYVYITIIIYYLEVWWHVVKETR